MHCFEKLVGLRGCFFEYKRRKGIVWLLEREKKDFFFEVGREGERWWRWWIEIQIGSFFRNSKGCSKHLDFGRTRSLKDLRPPTALYICNMWRGGLWPNGAMVTRMIPVHKIGGSIPSSVNFFRSWLLRFRSAFDCDYYFKRPIWWCPTHSRLFLKEKLESTNRKK